MSKNEKKEKHLKPNFEVAVLEKELLHYLGNVPGKNYHRKSIVKQFLLDYDKHEVQSTIDRLLKSGEIELTANNTIALKGSVAPKQSVTKSLMGRLDMTMQGYGFIICEDLDADVFVPPSRLGHSLDKDTVRFRVTGKSKTGRYEGEVTGVEKRNKNLYIGTLHVNGKSPKVVPESEKMPYEIYVDHDDLNNAQEYDKVVVELTDWPEYSKGPRGKITEILGESGNNDVEMKSILIENGFKLAFPDEVLKEVEDIADVIPDKVIAARRDMRKVSTFTIDPDDAKDFDDALSIEKLPNGLWQIGVHIADVSHYAKPGSALDKEAYERATSVYLVDRVSPMFPERLSNIICSLRPNEDKLTFSAVFDLDEKGKVHEVWYGRTVIHSDKRFTYRTAQDVLEGISDGPFSEEMQVMQKIALALRSERLKKGSIEFSSEEVRFKLDREGKPLDVYVKVSLDTNKLIEDYMLLANRYVAQYLAKLRTDKKPVYNVYRVHDYPNMEKLEQFADFARKFGYVVKFNDPDQVAETLNGLLIRVKGKPEENVLSSLAIRTMAKAFYTTKNIGHYGLAFEFYSHFTSPIRRYPDVLTHRVLDAVLEHEDAPYNEPLLEEMSVHCSAMERNAMSAERESVKYKQVEYMQDRIGQEFWGIISGVIGRGIFIELEGNKCEGFIPENKLSEYSTRFDESELTIVDTDTGRKFRFGERIYVRVVSTNLERRQIDFELADPENPVTPEESAELQKAAGDNNQRGPARPSGRGSNANSFVGGKAVEGGKPKRSGGSTGGNKPNSGGGGGRASKSSGRAMPKASKRKEANKKKSDRSSRQQPGSNTTRAKRKKR
jgi:ribonuclease R